MFDRVTESMISKKTSYRGMSGAIRRAINSGALKGVLTASDVRRVLPPGKAAAPVNVIEKSLSYMEKNKEIVRHKDKFYTKDSVPTLTGSAIPDSMITGKILNTEVRNGKLIATVEVTSLDAK